MYKKESGIEVKEKESNSCVGKNKNIMRVKKKKKPTDLTWII
jgi:hypothetical protein